MVNSRGWDIRKHQQTSGFSGKKSKKHMIIYKGNENVKKGGINKNMVNTNDFRTKTMFIERKNPSVENVWGIAVDIGYSGTKIFAPNCVACFPSFASPIEGSLLNVSSPGETTIFYRDGETGTVWKVGKAAQDVISTQDPDQNSSAIYGRQRYFNPMYKVIARTAMGIACTANKFGDPADRKVCLQTGLPNSYLRSDKILIQEALAGSHVFDLKTGSGEWKHFEITLEMKDINIMAQPVGTLLSVSSDSNGNATAESENYLTASIAICDPGFGTMDSFSLRGSEMKKVETSTECTMKKVLTETSNMLFQKYSVEVPVPAIQKFLERGYVTHFNRSTRSTDNIEFDDILEECNRAVAYKAIDMLCELYGNFLEYDYLIVTGGTGEAWYPYFVEAFSGMPNLTLIPGNQNTEGMMTDEHGVARPLPFIFNNVRGYYMFIQRRLSKEKLIIA